MASGLLIVRQGLRYVLRSPIRISNVFGPLSP